MPSEDSAGTSAQSDLSLHCPPEEGSDRATQKVHSKDSDQMGQMPLSIRSFSLFCCATAHMLTEMLKVGNFVEV